MMRPMYEYLRRFDKMKMKMEEVNELLKNLTAQSQQLGESMRQSALQLQGDGIIPPKTLVGEMESFQKEMQEAHQLLMLELGIEETTTPDAVSLGILQATVEQLQMSQHANEVLDNISLIVHRDDENFLPLQECRTVASLLKEKMQEGLGTDIHPEVQTVLDGKHPLCALLALVQTSDELDDDTWSQHNESITTAFGRQLATAVARGKLEIKKADETKDKSDKNRLQHEEAK